MKRTLAIVLLLSATGSAYAVDGGAVVGGALGGAAGAAVGYNLGGQGGAILGAAIGGGTGAAVGSRSNQPQAAVQVAPVSQRQRNNVQEDGDHHRHERHHDRKDKNDD